MIKYNFFGKNCQIDKELLDRQNLEQKLQQLDFKFEEILFLKQIHSNKVVVIEDKSKIFDKNNRPQADAIITNQKNITICVITADCAPILFFDQVNNIIGATHAGWRGALSGVIENTIFEMKKLGAKTIECEIGPMIQQDSYEVDHDLVDEFTQKNPENAKFFVKSAKEGKFQFDLNGFVEDVLKKCEVKNIINQKIDTLTNENDFHSFRRSTLAGENNYGRNLSVIILN